MPWREESRWQTVVRGTWGKEEPITWQELRTLGLLGRHLLVLMDSMAAIGAHEKGRSGIFAMLLQCRRLAAVAMAAGVRFVLRWTPGRWNFAGGPSRGEACGAAKSTRLEKEAPWDLIDALQP